MELLDVHDYNRFKKDYLTNLEMQIKSDNRKREQKWSESIAVGDKRFLKVTKKRLKALAIKREIHSSDDSYELRDDQALYSSTIHPENSVSWID